MKQDPHVPTAIRKEFVDWRLWWSRAVVVSMAAAAGLVVVLFTYLTELALDTFDGLYLAWWWAPLLWTPVCTAIVVWLTRRFAPGAAGSGIPQVMAALEPDVNHRDRGLFVSLKLTLAKFVLTAMGLLGGLSLGREGPSVQIAAGIMLAGRRLLPRRSVVSAHGLLVTGGAAGIAAAFNTPLAGVMFAIEELSRTPEQRSSGLLVAGIVLSGLIAISINGNATYFGVIRVPGVGLALFGPALVVALACGVAGGLFARLLLRSLRADGDDRFSRYRRAHPVLFAAGCGLAVAVVGVVTGGSTFGSGYSHTREMLEGTDIGSQSYVFFKFIATWITTWSGVPAGIFAPSLAIGGAMGNDIAQLMHYPDAPTLIALGMVGFLAAVTQAPMTAFIIVMEMVDGHALVLTLMACSLVSSAVSRTLSRPLYASLADLQLQRLARERPGTAAPASDSATDTTDSTIAPTTLAQNTESGFDAKSDSPPAPPAPGRDT
jgi:H+/Cl- antiporter ClcA